MMLVLPCNGTAVTVIQDAKNQFSISCVTHDILESIAHVCFFKLVLQSVLQARQLHHSSISGDGIPFPFCLLKGGLE